VVVTCVCAPVKVSEGGLVVDGRRLVVCRAVSRNAARQAMSQKMETTTDSRNLHLVRESCMFSLTDVCFVMFTQIQHRTDI